MDLISKHIPTPGTPDPAGTGSWAGDPGTSPWIFTSGGAGPVEVVSAVPCVEISVTVERNLESLFVMGDSKLAYLPPKQREVTASLTLVWLSQARYTDLQNFEDRTLTWTLSEAPASAITLSNCKFHRLSSFTMRPTDTVLERYDVTALSVK